MNPDNPNLGVFNPPPPMPGFDSYLPAPALSVSTLVSFSRCPRKYFYSFGVEIGTEEHIALKFGEAIHAGLGYAFSSDLTNAMRKFDLVWQDREGDAKNNRIAGSKIFLQFGEAHALSRSIYKLLPPPSGILPIADRISDYEIPFAIDIGLSVPLVGRIDGVCEHRDTGEKWVLEFKTTSEMSSRFFSGFTINPQLIAYTLALRTFGIPVRGAMVEGIFKPKGVTGKNDCMTQPVFVTDSMIEDFLTWARWNGSQILACEKYKNFPKDISSCVPYSQFGQPGYTCDFQPLCLMKDWTVGRSMYVHRSYPTFELLKPTLEGKVICSVTDMR